MAIGLATATWNVACAAVVDRQLVNDHTTVYPS